VVAEPVIKQAVVWVDCDASLCIGSLIREILW
jgi:hypothetical protein